MLIPTSGRPPPSWFSSAQPTGAIATAYNGRLGVCYINPNFGIDPGDPGETLVFKIGTAGPMVGRYFSKVDLSLQQVSNQFPNSSPWKMHAELWLKDKLVGTHEITHMGNTPFVEPIQISGTGVVNFDELRLTPVKPLSGPMPSISVSGGTSKQPVQTTFWLNDLLCGGETINTDFNDGSSSFDASATNTATAGTVCKPYAAFSWAAGRPDSNVLPASGPPAHLVFDTTATANAHVRLTIDWVLDECVPTPVAGGPPTCKVTYVNVTPNDPNAWAPQTFCVSASAALPWCTVEKTYTYETVSGVTKTHVHEIWEGFGDPQMW